MATLAGKTLFITGASRGIGEAIAVRAARDGANVAIIAKTDRPNPKLPGTIHTTAQAVEKAGGKALALAVDIRDADAIGAAVTRTAEAFGGIDILINNASAIYLAGTADTPIKRLDLMLDVNLRGSFVCAQACLPWLRKASNPHILAMAPPPNLDPRWFRHHVAYTLSKYGMSLAAFGLAAEFAKDGIAVNTLWPRTVIATAALAMLGGLVQPEQCRKPGIVADAAHAILTRNARECTGRHFIDEEVLAEAGVSDFEHYAVKRGVPLAPDLFLD
ncbi:MAG: SDR family oxidoreductase [Gammaproteobacteria bacterium]